MLEIAWTLGMDKTLPSVTLLSPILSELYARINILSSVNIAFQYTVSGK